MFVPNSGDPVGRLPRPVNVSRTNANLRAFAVLAFAWILATAGLLTLGSVRTYGQMNAATLNGTITDPNGGVIPGATVTVLNKDTNVEHNTKTNDVGFYYVGSLTPGNYIVTVTKAGFTVAKESNLTLQVA